VASPILVSAVSTRSGVRREEGKWHSNANHRGTSFAPVHYIRGDHVGDQWGPSPSSLRYFSWVPWHRDRCTAGVFNAKRYGLEALTARDVRIPGACLWVSRRATRSAMVCRVWHKISSSNVNLCKPMWIPLYYINYMYVIYIYISIVLITHTHIYICIHLMTLNNDIYIPVLYVDQAMISTCGRGDRHAESRRCFDLFVFRPWPGFECGLV
jgi:hypothetical protein